MNNLTLKEKVYFILWVLGLLFIIAGSLAGIITFYINTEDMAVFGFIWFLAIVLCLYFGLIGGVGLANILEKLNLHETIEKITMFLFVSIFLTMFLGFEFAGIDMLIKILRGQESYSPDFLFFILFPLLFIGIICSFVFPPIIAYIKGPDEKYFNYIEENKVSLGRFTRPVLNDKRKIVLANKYVILDFDIYSFSAGGGRITLTDKINAKCYKIVFFKRYGRKVASMHGTFIDICRLINYETVAENILKEVRKRKNNITEYEANTLSIDINRASEAELTALPGVTIARAKHAIKMRKKYAFYISMNQFYETINLEKEFIEQIKTRGNKILLNGLPEYKQLEMKRKEF